MLFTNLFFVLIFLPLSVLAFYVVGRTGQRTLCLAVIVAVSALFYLPHGALACAVLAASLACNLAVALALTGLSDRRLQTRRLLLAGGLLFNFSLLGLFKYANDISNVLAGVRFWAVAVPAGISFYTFHQAVFLIDAHGRRPEVADFLGPAAGTGAAAVRYAAFVGFFPQLVIGPIVYLSEFAPQVMRRSFGRFSSVNIAVGVSLIVIGLFKKLCLADPIAVPVDRIFTALSVGDPVSQAEAVFVFPGFFFQLYFDFSGYSDMALGLARLFGIVLPVNFDSPLRATGIVDFYRRWHMTLTRVIARFVFTPIAITATRFAADRGLKGPLRKTAALWIPLLLNFTVIALWHGAAWTFLVFGLIHGAWYVLETEWRSSPAGRMLQSRLGDRWRTLLGQVICVAPLMSTFALFRSPNLETFKALNVTLLKGGAGVGAPALADWAFLGLAAAIVYLAPNSQELMRRYRPGLPTFDNVSRTPQLLRLRWRPNLLWGMGLALLALTVAARLNKPSPFFYGGF